MRSASKYLALLALALTSGPLCSAKNPLFFGADPSALVAPDGRVWIYPTTDEANWNDQVNWHAWSSTNLVDWTDHGVIFSNTNSGWGSNNAWAPDCVLKNGKYYFYYYFNKGKPSGGVGVAVSDRPEGPFTEALGHRLIAGHDPRIFLDDDGQAYLYVQSSVYKLNDDMISLAGDKIDLDVDYRPKPFEAVYVFKRNGIYYYTIAAEFNHLIYYTGESPLGPFKYRGELMPKYGGNNHHSIVEYQGKWVLFYHGWVPGHHRMVRAEWLNFNDDGTIVSTPITEAGTGPLNCPPAAAAKQASLPSVPPPVYVNDLAVHDPCILADTNTQTYYIYRSFAPGKKNDDWLSGVEQAGVEVFTSKDLVKWTGPNVVFEMPADFWADKDSAPWAPEVHAYKGKYYLFTTFNAWKEKMDDRPDRPFINKRASQILVADSPLGPFQPFANHPTTPPGLMTLDATLYVEDGQPWMVYAHEWVQMNDGTIEAIRLKDDLSATVGEPIKLIAASDVPWTKRNINYKGTNYPGIVTDGPYLYPMKSGALALFWSSWSTDRKYAQTVAYSDSGKLAGPWRHAAEPLLQDDRGHGMVFCALEHEGKLREPYDGRLLLALHRYFHAPRVQIWTLEEDANEFKIGKQILGAE